MRTIPSLRSFSHPRGIRNAAFSVCALFVSLLAPQILYAAQVTVLPVQKYVIENAEFQTDITIDTGTESINTFSGTLAYPADIVTLKEIRTGGSMVNYWVEEPKGTNGEITFSGMT